jgi:hypothetical protein
MNHLHNLNELPTKAVSHGIPFATALQKISAQGDRLSELRIIRGKQNIFRAFL